MWETFSFPSTFSLLPKLKIYVHAYSLISDVEAEALCILWTRTNLLIFANWSPTSRAGSLSSSCPLCQNLQSVRLQLPAYRHAR